jgi:hypothetical protein
MSDTDEGAGNDGRLDGVVVQKGTGKFSVLAVPGSDTPVSLAPGRTVRYTVEAEGGLKVDLANFSSQVRDVLTGDRGWEAKDRVRFGNVTAAAVAKGAAVDVHITLASPDTVDRECAPLRTLGKVSCHSGSRVMLNVMRWLKGAASYGDDLASYRIYLINHEVGHSLGHGHSTCPKPGASAPVMVQQTLGLQGCKAWPYPVMSG